MSILKVVAGHRNRLLVVAGGATLLLILQFLENHAPQRRTDNNLSNDTITLEQEHAKSSDAGNDTFKSVAINEIDTRESEVHFSNDKAGASLSEEGLVTDSLLDNNSEEDSKSLYQMKMIPTLDKLQTVKPPNCTRRYHKDINYHPPGEQCQKRFPKAIVIGVQKCGTSALLDFLSRHPEISAVLEPTEVKYFNDFKQPLEFYRQMMNCSFSNQISMEKSPQYFSCSNCPVRIKEMNIDTKIIVIIKDPIERALSLYAMRKSIYKDRIKPFEQVVTNNVTGNIRFSSLVLRYSLYAHHMKHWMENFNLSQIHFVDGHNLELNPAPELNLVEEFLDIGSYFTCDMFLFNVTKGKYCFKIPGGMDCLHEGKGRQHQELSRDLLTKLQYFFRPLNEKFFQMVNRKFDWGY